MRHDATQFVPTKNHQHVLQKMEWYLSDEEHKIPMGRSRELLDSPWNCTACTYTNSPEAKRCEVCNTKRDLNFEAANLGDIDDIEIRKDVEMGEKEKEKERDKDTKAMKVEEKTEEERQREVGVRETITKWVIAAIEELVKEGAVPQEAIAEGLSFDVTSNEGAKERKKKGEFSSNGAVKIVAKLGSLKGREKDHEGIKPEEIKRLDKQRQIETRNKEHQIAQLVADKMNSNSNSQTIVKRDWAEGMKVVALGSFVNIHLPKWKAADPPVKTKGRKGQHATQKQQQQEKDEPPKGSSSPFPSTSQPNSHLFTTATTRRELKVIYI